MRLSVLIIIAATSLTNAFSPQSISSQHLLTTSTSGSTVFGHSSKLRVDTLLHMKKEDEAFLPSRNRRPFEDSSRPSSKVDGSLSASSIASGNFVLNGPQETNTIQNILEGLPEVANYLPVVSAALLITSNTVGASMMVLPGLAQGPGMIASSALIAAIYIINLFSGLLIAEVAINQYETSSCDVPSSFKEFASFNLQSEQAGNLISTISLFVNTCVLSYDLVTAGHLTNTAISSDVFKPMLSQDMVSAVSSSGNSGLFIAAAFFVALVSTQSGAALSGVASICCMTLFACFAGLVIPGLAMIHDPLAAFAAEGTSGFGSDVFMHDITSFVPVLLSAMIYQNIVPTITKMLNYDRTKTVMAIVSGSAIPMLMYIAFCFTVLGGNANVGGGSMFLTGITASSVFGSAMACVISISSEIDIFFQTEESRDCEISESSSKGLSPPAPPADGTASFQSVLLGVIPPVLAGVFFAEGDTFVKALSISGAYGSPLLYGVVPVVLAFSQRTAIINELQDNAFITNARTVFNKLLQNDTDNDKQLLPGGMVPMGTLIMCATALMCSHLVQDISGVLNTALL
jgi:tyrosine-specific transport protein